MINEYYFLKNYKTNEVEFLKDDEFIVRFGGAFEHIISNFCVNTYMEKGVEIPREKRQTIFFMAFIENWNKNKGIWSELQAISYYDLTAEEQQKINKALNSNKNIEEHIEEKQRNQKNKSVGNGEGSLYYSETLCCWVFQYYDTHGKRQTMKQKKKESVKDFKARVTAIKNKLNNGTYIEKRNDTVKSIIEEHIKQKFDDGVTTGRSYKRDKDTLQCIENCCSNFINKPIQKVTLHDIQIAKECMKDYSNSVIGMMWRLLKKAFSIASSYSVRLITFNIMNDENLKKPISNKHTKKVFPLTKAERIKLNNVLDNEERNHPYRNIVKLEWLTSMRIGEALSRSKNDVSAEKLHIHNTLTKDENGNIILGEHTKTYNDKTGIDEGERYFPISSEIKDIINEQLSNKLTNIYGLLFWDYKKNTFISGNEINSWLSRINAKYNISTTTLHNHRLRHDRITQWKEAGMDMKAIQYLAGHVEGSTVTDVYIDVSPEYVYDELKKAN